MLNVPPIQLDEEQTQKYLRGQTVFLSQLKYPSKKITRIDRSTFGIPKSTPYRLVDNLPLLKELIANYETAKTGKDKAIHEKLLVGFLKTHG